MPVDRATLVGRERHLSELGLLVSAVKAGRGHLVVLSGEAGAGKTRLAEEAASLATDDRVDVAWTTGWGSTAAPLSSWSDLLAQISPELQPAAHPARPTSEVGPDAARAGLVRSLVAQLREAVGNRPLLLIVDDAQWCDALSLSAIERLVASLRSSSVGVLATLRDDGALQRYAALTRAGRHLVVPPLDETELAALALHLTGRQLSHNAISRLFDRSAGNVLFAQELLAHATGGSLDGRDASPSVASSAIAMFADRLGAVSSECRQILETASVIGRRFRLGVLTETLGATDEKVVGLIGEANVARLVRESGIGAWEFSHPLMAEACYAGAGLPRRIRLHRDVGEALERLRDRGLAIPSAELAHHFANAAAAGVPAKAVHYAAAAGRESMDQLAYEDAARDFARALAALDLCPADDAARADLLLELGDAHAAAGDLPSARSAYETVVRVARENRWHERLARAALAVGSGPGGFEVAAFDHHQIAILEEAASVAQGTQRTQVLARLSVALSLDADGGRRARLSEDAIVTARAAGDSLALGYALASWCDVIAGPDDVERRFDATTEILVCATATSDTRLELLGRRLRLVAALEAGAIVDVDQEITAFADRAARLGQVVYSWYVPLWRAMRAVMEGRLDAADRLRRDAARLGAMAHSDNAAMLTGSQHAMVLCEIEAPREALAFFEDVMERWPGLVIMARPGLAYAYAVAGEIKSASDVLAAVTITDYTIDALGSEWLPSVVMLAYAAVRTRNCELSTELYDRLAPFRTRHAIDGIGCYDMGSVERALGMLAAVGGDIAVAREHFDAALRQHRRIGARLLVAGTLRDGGRGLDDTAMLDEAQSLYRELGLDRTADAIGTTNDPRGVRRGTNIFRLEGDVWLVGLKGTSTRVRDTKGMRDLAQLLARPGNEVHVLDLVTDGPTLRSDAPGDPVDGTARRQYRARLVEIDELLAEADRRADVALSERLHVERDALIAELSSAYGLGGRARRRGDSTERARSAVTQRIRDAITRIESAEPDLGGHLRHAIRTGTYCSYAPEHPTNWEL